MTTQNLANAITTLQAAIAGLTGIKAAPSTPPAQLSDFPAVVAYEGQGNWTFADMSALEKGLLTIVLEIHFPRSLWDYAFITLNNYTDAVPKAIAKSMYNSSIGGYVITYSNIRTTGVIPMKWGDIDTIGQKWLVEGVMVKLDLTT
jgi:hypothetical protein